MRIITPMMDWVVLSTYQNTDIITPIPSTGLVIGMYGYNVNGAAEAVNYMFDKRSTIYTLDRAWINCRGTVAGTNCNVLLSLTEILYPTNTENTLYNSSLILVQFGGAVPRLFEWDITSYFTDVDPDAAAQLNITYSATAPVSNIWFSNLYLQYSFT